MVMEKFEERELKRMNDKVKKQYSLQNSSQIYPRKENATYQKPFSDKIIITSSIQAYQLPPPSRNPLNRKNAKSKKNWEKNLKLNLPPMKRIVLSGIKSNLFWAYFTDELFLEK